MGSGDAEVVIALYEALNRREVASALHLLAPDVEVRTTVETFRGIEGIRAWLAEVDRTFEDYTAAAGEPLVVGDRVVVDVHQSGRGRGSGIDIDHTFTHVWTIRDGRATSLRAYTGRAEALAAVGVPGG